MTVPQIDNIDPYISEALTTAVSVRYLIENHGVPTVTLQTYLDAVAELGNTFAVGIVQSWPGDLEIDATFGTALSLYAKLVHIDVLEFITSGNVPCRSLAELNI